MTDKKKILDLPLFVNDQISDPPVKPAGRRRIVDLDQFSTVPNDAELIIQVGSKTMRCTKAQLLSSALLADTSYDDMRFPASAENIDANQTRYSFDYTELAVTFDADARHANELLGYIAQMQHKWKEGSLVLPHVHWIQTSAAVPNWTLQYRTYNNNEDPTGAWTTVAWDSQAFTYSSGTIMQITGFPDIDMTGKTISSFIDMKLSRDVGNVTTLHAGADPLAAAVSMKEFDIHYEIDSFGSNGEYTKTTG